MEHYLNILTHDTISKEYSLNGETLYRNNLPMSLLFFGDEILWNILSLRIYPLTTTGLIIQTLDTAEDMVYIIMGDGETMRLAGL